LSIQRIFVDLGTVFHRLTHSHHVTHTNLKFLQTSTINYSINMAAIDDVLAAFKLLQPGEEPNFTQCGKEYLYRNHVGNASPNLE
jgi:hypothetical protein